MKERPYPKAVSVKSVGKYQIEVTYTNEETYLYDVTHDIESIKSFKKLTSQEEFSKVYLAYGGMSIAWGDGDEFSDPTMDVEVPYAEGILVGR